MLQARDIMTKAVLTVSPETLVSDLAKTLVGKNIGGVPVVDADGRLVGIVTQSDLVERAQELELPPALNILDLHLYLDIPSHLFHKLEKMLGATVGDIMSPKPVTVSPDTPMPRLAALMAKQKVHTLPVLEAGKIVGIIGKIDLVRALAREWAGEEAGEGAGEAR
ncbi:MAG: CBS domain-containing protein [Desulfobaccales bacterium]|jgi:CBS-domain-containing membrane protein